MLNPHSSPCSSSPPQRHVKKSKSVSFSNEVSQVDGNAVTIQQEHDVDVVPRSRDYLLGRSIGGMNAVTYRVDDNESRAGTNQTNPEEGGKHPSVVEEISHDDKNNDGEQIGGNRVVVVRMGLLKCGHRYRVVVPIPHLFVDNDDSHGIGEICGNDDAVSAMHGLNLNDGQGSNEQQKMLDDPRKNKNTGNRIRTEARIIHDSWDDDDDLQGEMLETSDDGTSHVGILLSARQRGPYCGRLAVEFVSSPTDIDKIPRTNNRISSEMSILVEASIMGKGMGTPQLRNGVTCLGKLAGYDSDEETQWQGFD